MGRGRGDAQNRVGAVSKTTSKGSLEYARTPEEQAFFDEESARVRAEIDGGHHWVCGRCENTEVFYPDDEARRLKTEKAEWESRALAAEAKRHCSICAVVVAEDPICGACWKTIHNEAASLENIIPINPDAEKLVAELMARSEGKQIEKRRKP